MSVFQTVMYNIYVYVILLCMHSLQLLSGSAMAVYCNFLPFRTMCGAGEGLGGCKVTHPFLPSMVHVRFSPSSPSAVWAAIKIMFWQPGARLTGRQMARYGGGILYNGSRYVEVIVVYSQPLSSPNSATLNWMRWRGGIWKQSTVIWCAVAGKISSVRNSEIVGLTVVLDCLSTL
jgi:hypothetical protein